jgi:hypothetical protein
MRDLSQNQKTKSTKKVDARRLLFLKLVQKSPRARGDFLLIIKNRFAMAIFCCIIKQYANGN